MSERVESGIGTVIEEAIQRFGQVLADGNIPGPEHRDIELAISYQYWLELDRSLRTRVRRDRLHFGAGTETISDPWTIGIMTPAGLIRIGALDNGGRAGWEPSPSKRHR